MNKNEIRLYSINLRKGLDSAKASNNIIEYIINNKIIDKFDNIGIYYPIKNEINILKLLELYPNKNFYLPKTKDDIYFVKYRLGDELIKAKFNTFEPLNDDIIDRLNIDCFIIPSVAISNQFKRIGYGKGYYDRYLNNYNGYKIGVIYKELNNFDIELDSHDLKFDLVIEG